MDRFILKNRFTHWLKKQSDGRPVPILISNGDGVPKDTGDFHFTYQLQFQVSEILWALNLPYSAEHARILTYAIDRADDRQNIYPCPLCQRPALPPTDERTPEESKLACFHSLFNILMLPPPDIWHKPDARWIITFSTTDWAERFIEYLSHPVPTDWKPAAYHIQNHIQPSTKQPKAPTERNDP